MKLLPYSMVPPVKSTWHGATAAHADLIILIIAQLHKLVLQSSEKMYAKSFMVKSAVFAMHEEGQAPSGVETSLGAAMTNVPGHVQYVPRNMHTVLLCFALLWLCNRSQWIQMKCLSIFIRVALLALGQSLDCHSASEVSLVDMGKSVNV